MPSAATQTGTGFAPVVASTGEALQLSLQRLWLTGKILPVGARLYVQHIFESAERKPIEVVYTFALPRDAALRRFRVEGRDFAVSSELKPVAEATREYEEGIADGHLSTLARVYGDGMVSLNLGNLQPGEWVTVLLEIVAGVDVRDDGLRFRFPFTLAPSYHRRAKTALTGPDEAEMELPREEFDDLILPRYVRDATSLHQVGFDLEIQMGACIRESTSPSHTIRVAQSDEQNRRVCLAAEADVPDRDLVLDVRTVSGEPSVLAGAGENGRCHFAAVVPSSCFETGTQEARRVVFVIDRSGSMGGLPMEQAKTAVKACLAALSEADQFGLVAFDDRVEVFRPSLATGGAGNRQAALKFIGGVDARGGTELIGGVAEAAKMLGKEGGDLFVITDGQVFGTESILAEIRRIGARVHALGIGSASQDRLLTLLARQTQGTSRFVTPRERVDLAAVELFAGAGRPVARNLTVSSQGLHEVEIQPEPPKVVHSGQPLVVFGEAATSASGSLGFEWDADSRRRRLDLPFTKFDDSLAEPLRLIRGARLITDLESQIVPEGAMSPSERRHSERLERKLEALSDSLGLASRRRALVAVVKRAGDRAGEVPKTHVVRVGMPQDVEFTSYFVGAQLSVAASRLSVGSYLADFRPTEMFAAPQSAQSRVFAAEGPDDALLDLSCRLEPDGGLPGDDLSARIAWSLMALLAFLQHGHRLVAGAFRVHVQRLVDFLEKADTARLTVSQRETVIKVLDAARRDGCPPGDWLEAAGRYLSAKRLKPGKAWEELAVVSRRQQDYAV